MPLAVTFKLLAVMIKLLVPVLIDEANNPERLIAPDVPLTLTAPVVTVNPFDAVNNPLEVIVPVPVVEILPEVETLPEDVMSPLIPKVRVGVDPDTICKALWAALVSVITKAEAALPALVKVNCLELAAARLKAMFCLTSVALILLPAS